jgi:hypothetical protein
MIWHGGFAASSIVIIIVTSRWFKIMAAAAAVISSNKCHLAQVDFFSIICVRTQYAINQPWRTQFFYAYYIFLGNMFYGGGRGVMPHRVLDHKNIANK